MPTEWARQRGPALRNAAEVEHAYVFRRFPGSPAPSLILQSAR